MKALRVRLDRSLSDLDALGLGDVDRLFGPRGGPHEGAVPLEENGTRTRMRIPLPGTVDAEGRLTGRPGEAGTGWIVLERWRGSRWRSLVRARFTSPRSESLAERAWNLLCHLRAHGVGTPQPLAVGAMGKGPIARSSFLVTRELADYEALPVWFGRERPADEHERGLRALAALEANLLRSRVFLPNLTAEQIFVHRGAEDGAADCTPVPGAGEPNRLPGIVLTDVTGGVIRPALSKAERERMQAVLAPFLRHASF